jgi:hypothetical protein
LRAFTPRDQKAVKAAAETFRRNPSFDTAAAITELAGGEALVSMLDPKGNPEIVARSLIAPPMARAGTISDEERQRLLLGKYETVIDRPSAFQTLRDRSQPGGQEGASRSSAGGLLGSFTGALGGLFKKTSAGGGQRMSTAEIALRSAVQSAARTAVTKIGQAILRGILGGKSKK